MNELKQCPFCGGAPTFRKWGIMASVHCPCGGESGISESDSQAQEYWNRRPLEDALRERLRILVEKAHKIYESRKISDEDYCVMDNAIDDAEKYCKGIGWIINDYTL